MLVSTLVAQAFAQSRAKYPAIADQWREVSSKAGSWLPNSLLMASVQNEGNFDLLLRCLEDETLSRLQNPEKKDSLMSEHYLNQFSAYWMGNIYEILRLLRSRKLVEQTSEFEKIFHPLELVRVGIEKHEIAKDRTFEEPVTLQRLPRNHTASDFYQYDAKDDKKSHIMPMAVSQINGSMMWLVTDAKANSSYWVERRFLSDKILEIWSTTKSEPIAATDS